MESTKESVEHRESTNEDTNVTAASEDKTELNVKKDARSEEEEATAAVEDAPQKDPSASPIRRPDDVSAVSKTTVGEPKGVTAEESRAEKTPAISSEENTMSNEATPSRQQHVSNSNENASASFGDAYDGSSPLPSTKKSRTQDQTQGDASQDADDAAAEISKGRDATGAAAIEPFAARLLASIIRGDVDAFESVLDAYRVTRDVNPTSHRPYGSSPSPSPSQSSSPMRRTKNDGNSQSSPLPVDEASKALLSYDLERRDISATALFWAGYAGHSSIIGHIQRHYEEVFAAQAKRVAKQLLDYKKDLAAVSILVRNKTPAAVINPHRGETCLHRLVRRTKPDAQLINELLKTYRKFDIHAAGDDEDGGAAGAAGDANEDEENEEDDIDALNNDGYSALQLVAMYSKGVDGRIAAQVLLSHGADVLCPSAKGGNARTLAQNPHVRAVLGFRTCPSPQVDEDTKKKIDSVKSIHQLPPLPPIEVEQPKARDAAESLLNPNAATDEEKSRQLKTVRVLDKDGVENLVRRLYDQTLQLREEKSAARRQALEPPEARRLTAEEQQAVADRLCNESLENKEYKMQELMSKYLVEKEPNPLDEEQQMEMANRLCNQSMERKQQSLKTLDEKYWGHQQASKKVISQEQVKACASRLHDESTSHTREKFEKLATQYLQRPKGEFMKDRVLSHEEREEAKARLYQSK